VNAGENFDRLNRMIGRMRPMTESGSPSPQRKPRPYGSRQAESNPDPQHDPYEDAYNDGCPESHSEPPRHDPDADPYNESYNDPEPTLPQPDPPRHQRVAYPASTPTQHRLLSLDVFRGLIMCTLAANGLAFAATARRLGFGLDTEVASFRGQIWQWLAFHNSHPIWNSQFYVVGCSFWDLIQPAFMFMVGVAMPFSYAHRIARGDSTGKLASHALLRALVLIALGVFLQTHSTGLDSNRLLTNVLSQIGLGYFFVFLLLGRGARTQIAIAAIVLAGYWAWFVAHPVPDRLPWAASESITDLSALDRYAKHFAFDMGPAAEVDVKLFNWLPPHGRIHSAHPAGYVTLNFIPSAVTMLLGVLAGTLLRSRRNEYEKVRLLAVGGAICMVCAIALSFTVCPVVKKIWTPAWTLYSGAWVLWMLAWLYWVIDVRGWRGWTFPLVIVGMNSLAMYLMGMLFKGWVSGRWQVYFGDGIFAGAYGPTFEAIAVFAVFWLVCLYLYRSKIFFRV
jgi:heparan-alpha-glucosaminide N-acetyltransferase